MTADAIIFHFLLLIMKQVIVTVALVPPRKGVFQDSVKHVLAVATTVEVILLAVTYEGEQASGNGSCRNRRIQVSPIL